MKLKTLVSGLLAAALSALTASACLVQVRVACPNDTTASGIKVCIAGSITGCALTDNLGIVSILVPAVGNYTICVDPSTLPAGATLKPNCKILTCSRRTLPTLISRSVGISAPPRLLKDCAG